MLLPLLPPELKLSIVDHLDPFSTVNFGLTCRHHWELYRPVIEKHARSFAEAPVVDAVDVWKLLRDILQDDSRGRLYYRAEPAGELGDAATFDTSGKRGSTTGCCKSIVGYISTT
jgi:hypothetical protein